MIRISRTTVWRMIFSLMTTALLSSPGIALGKSDPGQQAVQTMQSIQTVQQAQQQAILAAQQATEQALRDAQQANQQAAQAAMNNPPPVPTHPGYGKADKPSFSPRPGTFRGPVHVVISDASTPRAEIFYTLDGSRPTLASTPYTGPLLVSSTTKLRAIAKSPIYSASRIADGKYVIH